MTELLETQRGVTEYSRERRYERFVYGERYSDQVVKMSQVRGEQNIVKSDLGDDIDQNGLINPIDVGVIGEELLIEYLGFVKQTWGEAAELDDFAELRQSDGKYTLLIAGHSRHQAIDDLEESECLETGKMVRYPIPVKIWDIQNVWDIINIQLGENIHSTPPKERQAIAMVEAYEYGIQTGSWKTVDEFLKKSKNKKITNGSMELALKFRSLPAEIRSYVLSGPVHYYAGIELAKTVEPLKQFYIAKLGISDEDLPDYEKQIDEIIKRELSILANRTVKEKMNSTASKAHIKKWRMHWVKARTVIAGKSSASNAFELDFVTQDMAGQALRDKDRELKAQLRELAGIKGADLAAMIQLAGPQVGKDYVQECLEVQVADAEQSVARGRQALGKQASDGAHALSLMEFELDLEHTA